MPFHSHGNPHTREMTPGVEVKCMLTQVGVGGSPTEGTSWIARIIVCLDCVMVTKVYEGQYHRGVPFRAVHHSV